VPQTASENWLKEFEERQEVARAYQACENETEVFVLAFTKFGGVKGFNKKPNPKIPTGYLEAFNAVINVKPSEKDQAMQAFEQNYGGYRRKKQEVEMENLSHKNFLEQAEKHFESKGMMNYAAMAKQGLLTHRVRHEKTL